MLGLLEYSKKQRSFHFNCLDASNEFCSDVIHNNEYIPLGTVDIELLTEEDLGEIESAINEEDSLEMLIWFTALLSLRRIKEAKKD